MVAFVADFYIRVNQWNDLHLIVRLSLNVFFSRKVISTFFVMMQFIFLSSSEVLIDLNYDLGMSNGIQFDKEHQRTLVFLISVYQTVFVWYYMIVHLRE